MTTIEAALTPSQTLAAEIVSQMSPDDVFRFDRKAWRDGVSAMLVGDDAGLDLEDVLDAVGEAVEATITRDYVVAHKGAAFSALNDAGFGYTPCARDADINYLPREGVALSRAERDDDVAVYTDGRRMTIVGLTNGPWAGSFTVTPPVVSL